MKSPLLLCAFAAATIATTNAGLVISEIDLANNKVEILNTGPGTENLTPYYLCNRIVGSPRYPAINSLAIDVPNSSNGTLILAAGEWVTLIAAAGTITDASGELGLYINNLNFGVAANMLDYVAWGANATRDSVAASLGIWGNGTFIVVSGITPGQTIQLLAGQPGNSVAHYTLAASTIGVNQVTPAPSATTGSASDLAETTATFSGTVNAKGVSTTVTFEYGETEAYGSSMAATPSPVTGTTDTAVSAAIAGLIANTPYNFRVVATSANGTTFGANQTFTTTGAPGVVTGGASGVTNVAATLGGTVDANGADATVTFEYGETIMYDMSVAGSPSPVSGTTGTAVSAVLAGLDPATTYHYRAVATNSNGTVEGADQTFTTLGPPVVMTGAASDITSGSANVAGTVNAQGASTVVTIEYGETILYGSSVAATPSPVTGQTPTAISGMLAGLEPETIYHYRVVATNDYGTVEGFDDTFTTAAFPGMVPLVITAVSRSGNTLTVDFTGPPNVLAADWEVGGSTTLTSFPDDKTADTTFSEDPLGSGNYEALIDVTGDPSTYFVRILLP